MIPSRTPARLSSVLRSLAKTLAPRGGSLAAAHTDGFDPLKTSRPACAEGGAAVFEPGPRVLDAQPSTDARTRVHEGLTSTDGGGGIRFQIANTRALREMAYRLILDLYRSRGYAQPNREEIWFQLHHGHPQTVTLLALREHTALATLSVVPDSELGLPADAIFPERLEALRRCGRRLCEFSSLAVREDLGAAARGVLLELFALAYGTACHHAFDDVMVSVMLHHAMFYRRVLLFDEIAAESRISPRTGARVGLGRLDLSQLPHRYHAHYGTVPSRRNLYLYFCDRRRLSQISDWIREQHVPLAAADLHYFGMELGALHAATPAEWARLQQQYAPEEWARVMGAAPLARGAAARTGVPLSRIGCSSSGLPGVAKADRSCP